MSAVFAEFPLVSQERLTARIEALAEIGDTGDGGSCRLALTDADKAGRDLVCSWMVAIPSARASGPPETSTYCMRP